MQNKELSGQKSEVGLITEPRKNTVFLIAFMVVIILLWGWHVFICRHYPYYFIWDMDHITCLDTVLIQSRLLPDHICHPCFGMYLPLFFSHKIAYLFSIVSALDLEDLAASLNPLAAMAEMTDFIRFHSPFLSVGIAFLLCLAVHLIFGLSPWYMLFFLVFLGVQESLVYHSSMIRTELYSVFYWSGAILAMAIATKATTLVKRYGALLITGILLGLCFLTKIQSLFYLAAAPVLLLLTFSIFESEHKQNRGNITRKNACWILAISLFNVIVFVILAAASYRVPIPPGVPTWAESFGVTPITAIFFVALLLLFFCQLLLYLTNRVSSDIFMYSCFFSIVAAGFMLSFTLYFLIYSDPAMSLQYLLLNFKMVFLRVTKLLRIPEPSTYISNLLLYLYHNPVVFIVNITLIVLLLFGHRFGFVRITKGQLILCLLATALAFSNMVVMARPIFRDTLWKEVLVNFLSLFYFAILINRATRYRLVLARAGSGLLIVLFLVNCVHAYNVPKRLDAEATHYGWQADKFFSGVYGGNQRKYSEIMRRKYNNTTAWVARTKAIDHRRIRRTVDFVFKNQAITHRNIGIVFEGFSAWGADLDYRIAEAPPAIKGAILVDNASVGLKKSGFFKEEHVRQKSWYPYKFKKAPSVGLISVLTRPDLKIFLFVNADDVSGLVTEEIVQTPYKIVLKNNEQSIELQGLEIKNYCEVPLDKISRKFFFVIQRI